MNRSRWRLTVALMAAFALIGGFVAVPHMTTAQDSATPMAGETEHNHPIHIHAGTCDAVGEVVFPLNNLTSDDDMSSPEAGMADDDMSSPTTEMDDSATPDSAMMDDEMRSDYVAKSTTTITATFDDLTGAEHVINVHESEENIAVYIACGAVFGTPTDGQLIVALGATNSSGWEGDAVLVDNGDGTIDVTVHLRPVAPESDMGTPEATPES
ncbi:MAG: hypothetical protein AB7U20_18710 [Planctomycetaceae bacterium]